MRLLIPLMMFVVIATSSVAGTLTVTVKTPSGQPVKDAVVTIAAPGAHGPIKFDWPLRMAQQNIQFEPFVLIAPVNSDVPFPNFDKVRHHVYSFSPTKRFELKLYGHDETRAIHFDKTGTVALGCNIHDTMIGFIRVVDTPYAAKSNDKGVAVLHDVPTGRLAVHVWHPYLKGPDNESVQTVTAPVQGDAEASLAVDVRPQASMPMH